MQYHLSETFADQQTRGPGTVPPEAPGFIAGAPLAPNTPYDLFTSAPEIPGIANVLQGTYTVRDRLAKFDLSLTGDAIVLNGSTTIASYWTENLVPGFNPHLGEDPPDLPIVFPAHPGIADDESLAGVDPVTTMRAATADGNLVLTGGFFDLAQTDRFVFAQPALTSVNPTIAYAPAESLAPAVAGSDWWQPAATALPLDGGDVVARHGLATLELSNAELPELPGETARLTMGSLVVDHGDGTRYSVQALHAWTGGLSFTTTVPFGADPAFVATPQGVLPTSTLSGQDQSIAGASVQGHVVPRAGIDGTVEYGRATYAASPAALPGTEGPGFYAHVGLHKTLRRATAFLDWYRMGPRYATMILPYGIAENQWSTAFAWPGQWLKSNYQLIDNSVLGVNREGTRLRYFLDGGPFEARFEYTRLRQLSPETTVTAEQDGYVDGYYLPQNPADATLGTQTRSAMWLAWHPAFGDLTLDVVDDVLARPNVRSQPQDAVGYSVPQAVFTFARHVSPATQLAVGIGRYAIRGTFAEPLDFAERLAFAGAIVRESSRASLLISLRRTAFSGLSTFPAAGVAPDFLNSGIIVEQRYGN